MTWLWTATLTLLAAANALDMKPFDPPTIKNSQVTEFRHINEIYIKLTGSHPAFDMWDSITQQAGIEPCHPIKLPEGTTAKILATESGILNDDNGKGDRTIVEDTMGSGNKQVQLRYTYDRVVTPTGTLCGFELFIKTKDGKYLGVALNSKGEILKEVPRALAYDKHGNKLTNKKVETITSGNGCFECHPSVSKTYAMQDAETFWPKEEKLRPHRQKKPKTQPTTH